MSNAVVTKTQAAIRFDTSASNAFYRTVKQRVQCYFDASGKNRYADGRIIVKSIVFIVVIAVAYSVLLWNPFSSAWMLLAVALVYGVTTLLLAINVGHDAVHHALTPSKSFNRFVSIGVFSLLGVDGELWKLRHIKAHHVHPNVKDCDSAITRNPLLRLSPHQEWVPRYRFQHVYAPLVYAVLSFHSIFRQDFLYLFNRKQLASIGPVRYSSSQYAAFVASKSVYLSITLAIPLVVIDLPWWQTLFGYLIMTSVVSSVFVFLLIGTHFCDETEFFEADDDGALPHNFAYHSMVTSCDWSPHSSIAQFLLGGTNSHATHHLLPNICHTHYRALAPIIEQTAAEYGVPYNVLTLREMIISHFRFLKRLGEPPASWAAQESKSTGIYDFI